MTDPRLRIHQIVGSFLGDELIAGKVESLQLIPKQDGTFHIAVKFTEVSSQLKSRSTTHLKDYGILESKHYSIVSEKHCKTSNQVKDHHSKRQGHRGKKKFSSKTKPKTVSKGGKKKSQGKPKGNM